MDLLLNSGIASSYFINDLDTYTCHYMSPDILVCDGDLDLEHLAQFIVKNQPKSLFGKLFGKDRHEETFEKRTQKLLSTLHQMLSDQQLTSLPELKRPLLLIANALDERLISSLRISKIRGIWEVVAVKTDIKIQNVFNWFENQGLKSEIFNNKSPLIKIYSGSNQLTFVGGKEQSILSTSCKYTDLIKQHPSLLVKFSQEEIEREIIWSS